MQCILCCCCHVPWISMDASKYTTLVKNTHWFHHDFHIPAWRVHEPECVFSSCMRMPCLAAAHELLLLSMGQRARKQEEERHTERERERVREGEGRVKLTQRATQADARSTRHIHSNPPVVYRQSHAHACISCRESRRAPEGCWSSAHERDGRGREGVSCVWGRGTRGAARNARRQLGAAASA